MSSTQNQEGGDEQCESEHNVSGCRYEPGRPAWARSAHPLGIWCVRQRAAKHNHNHNTQRRKILL